MKAVLARAGNPSRPRLEPTVLAHATLSLRSIRGFPEDLADVQDVGGVCHVGSGGVLVEDMVDFVDAAQGAEVIFMFVDIDMGAVKACCGREAR